MEQKKGAGRIAKWDNARWILITLVVICHFFENYLGNPVANSLFFYVYTFHMPAFFLIAGLFSKENSRRQKNRQSCTLHINLHIY